MNRVWSFLPLVPILTAVIVWFTPSNSSPLVYNSAIATFNMLRADIFVGSFYVSALIAIALLCLRPSRLTAVVGLVTCFTFLNVVYLWTAARITTFQWLVWAAWSPSNEIGFYALDWLTIGMVGLVAVLSFIAWFKEGLTLTAFRTLEVASLAVLLLPTYILTFDSGEFYLHVANVGPAWLTNKDLLFGTAAMLAASSFVDYLVRRERKKAIGSALAAVTNTAST